MDQYGAVVRRLAEENKCLFVDTQAALDEVLKYVYPAALALDRVHPIDRRKKVYRQEELPPCTA